MKEFSDKTVLKQLGSDTRKSLSIHNVRVAASTNRMQYTKKNPKMLFHFKQGFDLMQYTIVVRPFVLKLYQIEKEIILDVLLYLFPIQYFTNKDFNLLPLRNTGYNRKQLILLGYVDRCVEITNRGGNIYCLSEKSMRIVNDYYKYMSGEKTIGSSPSVNPFMDEEASSMDRSREKLMKELKVRLDSQPNLFKNTFF